MRRIWDEVTSDPAMHMARLFCGRTDAVGADRGGCIRINGDDEFVDALRAHLDGAGTGVYCFMPDATTWWGCIDIDTGDLGLARNIVRLLDKVGVTSWLEVSRSKGFHIWIFASEPVPVRTMRDAQLAIGQMLDVDLKECNPKQYTLPDGAIGNYVRLPYLGGAHGELERQVVVDPQALKPYALKAFLASALRSRNTPQVLAQVAALYRPPAPAPTVPAGSQTTSVTNASGYVKAALEGEFADVSACASGGRNRRLYESAMKLGRFIAAGQATEDEIERTLMDAALANGLVHEDGDIAVRATIRSGLRNGAARAA